MTMNYLANAAANEKKKDLIQNNPDDTNDVGRCSEDSFMIQDGNFGFLVKNFLKELFQEFVTS